jgi:small subunit ribosomal protein S6
MFILKPTLTPEETQAKIEAIKNIITSTEGEISAVEDMGTRPLAYEIEKQKRGYYYVIYFKTDASHIAELERNYRINEDIIRFIVVKYESKTEQKAWQGMVDKANKKVADKKPAEEKAETPAQ